jgi:hypothetical protein
VNRPNSGALSLYNPLYLLFSLRSPFPAICLLADMPGLLLRLATLALGAAAAVRAQQIYDVVRRASPIRIHEAEDADQVDSTLRHGTGPNCSPPRT